MADRFARILVLLEDPMHLPPVLPDAAALAARANAELICLLVENDELRQLAALPFSHEVVRGSARHRNLDPERLERQLRRRAESIRRAFSRVASEQRLRTSVRIVQSHVQAGEVAAQECADVLFVACHRHSKGSGMHRMPNRSEPRIPIAAFYNPTVSANRVLQVAAILQHGHRVPLLVFVHGGNEDHAAVEVESARAAVSAQMRETPFTLIQLHDNETPEQAAARYHCRLLITSIGNNDMLHIVKHREDILDIPIALVA